MRERYIDQIVSKLKAELGTGVDLTDKQIEEKLKNTALPPKKKDYADIKEEYKRRG